MPPCWDGSWPHPGWEMFFQQKKPNRPNPVSQGSRVRSHSTSVGCTRCVGKGLERHRKVLGQLNTEWVMSSFPGMAVLVFPLGLMLP